VLPEQVLGEAHWVPADREQDGEHARRHAVKATPAQRASWVVVHAEITLELHVLQLEHAAVPVVDALYVPAGARGANNRGGGTRQGPVSTRLAQAREPPRRRSRR
jgi:hypothetical protein